MKGDNLCKRISTWCVSIARTATDVDEIWRRIDETTDGD